jgi:glycine/D-amino acid oxidase-like deaminating enzyme
MANTFHQPRSLWEATAKLSFSTVPLEGEAHSDVVIIGAGFAGLSAALHLRQQGKSVIVLDKGGAGWGGSGRNGGQVNPGWKRSGASIRAEYGEALGDQIMAVSNDACDLTFFLIDEHQIDCAPVRNGYLWAGYGQSGVQAIKDRFDAGQPDGQMTVLSAGEAAEITGAVGYSGALLNRRGGSVQPLDYARGLARVVEDLGGKIYAPAAATKIIREGGAWRIETAEGVVHGDHLLMAVNGYGDDVQAKVARTVVPVVSCQIASEPLAPEILDRILPDGQHVSDTRHVGVYYRRSPDNRFVMGGRGQNKETQDEQKNRALLVRETEALFPFLKGQAWPHYWHGYVAMTSDSLPNLIDIGPNAYAGLGFNGRGVAMATMMGKMLADCVAGKPTALPLSPPQPIAFHGLRQIGVGAYIQWARIKDRFAR